MTTNLNRTGQLAKLGEPGEVARPESAAVLVKAADLASSGRYTEAVGLLAELGGRQCADPAVLDLLARMHAQQGELFDADECWALAQRIDPDLPTARAGRRRIAALQVRGFRPKSGRATALVIAAGVVIAAGAVAVVLTRPAPGPDPSVIAALNRTGNAQRQLSQQVNGLSSRLDQPALNKQRLLDSLRSALAGSTVLTARVQSGAVVVTFDSGLFSTGSGLSDQGKADLAEFAGGLGALASQVSITLVGHTDNAQQPHGYPDNVQLGLDRATAAAGTLATVSGQPLADFALTSDGAANPPFPNTTAAGRAANRTVTIVLRPSD